MDVLQSDIDALEHEKAELKEKIKLVAKRSMVESLSRSSSLTAAMGGSCCFLSYSYLVRHCFLLFLNIKYF